MSIVFQVKLWLKKYKYFIKINKKKMSNISKLIKYSMESANYQTENKRDYSLYIFSHTQKYFFFSYILISSQHFIWKFSRQILTRNLILLCKINKFSRNFSFLRIEQVTQQWENYTFSIHIYNTYIYIYRN